MLTIVDYNAGNLRSVQRACDAVGVRSHFTQDADVVARADRIIFPGVGHARAAMDTLQKFGLTDAIRDAFSRGVPILGICVGAQLMLEGSDEGDTTGIALMPGRTRRFDLPDKALKVPHMGWNTLTVREAHPLLSDMDPKDAVYFVHSYYLDPADDAHRVADSEYGGAFCCAMGRDNLFATQFHPEKSGRVGLELLRRFSTWEGSPC